VTGTASKEGACQLINGQMCWCLLLDATDIVTLTLGGRYQSAEIGDVLSPEFMNYWVDSPGVKMAN